MITLTPNRDAVLATVQETQRRYASVIAKGDVEGLGQEMAIRTSEAILLGAADLLDRDVKMSGVFIQVSMALAGGLSSFLLTAARGDAELAERLLPGAIGSLQELALKRLRRDPNEWVVGSATQTEPRGQA